jgi:predicted kinase
MAGALVLVNGLPDSGKTTLASGLAAPLGAVLLSKDAVKEALAELLPRSRRRASSGRGRDEHRVEPGGAAPRRGHRGIVVVPSA